MRSGPPLDSGGGTTPARLLASMLGIALGIGLAPAMSMPLDWKPVVIAQPLELHCVREGVIHDTQTRAEIERRNHIAGRTQDVAQLIREMDAAGFDVTGPRDAETLSIALPYRIVIDKRIDFRLRVLPAGLYVTRVASPGRARVKVNEDAKRYLTPSKVAEMDRNLQGWADQTRGELEAVYREWGGGKLLRFTDDEQREMRLRRTGEVERSTTFDFCEEPRRVRFIATWSRPLPELMP